jgi:hypothetical protein
MLSGKKRKAKNIDGRAHTRGSSDAPSQSLSPLLLSNTLKYIIILLNDTYKHTYIHTYICTCMLTIFSLRSVFHAVLSSAPPASPAGQLPKVPGAARNHTGGLHMRGSYKRVPQVSSRQLFGLLVSGSIRSRHCDDELGPDGRVVSLCSECLIRMSRLQIELRMPVVARAMEAVHCCRCHGSTLR